MTTEDYIEVSLWLDFKKVFPTELEQELILHKAQGFTNTAFDKQHRKTPGSYTRKHLKKITLKVEWYQAYHEMRVRKVQKLTEKKFLLEDSFNQNLIFKNPIDFLKESYRDILHGPPGKRREVTQEEIAAAKSGDHSLITVSSSSLAGVRKICKDYNLDTLYQFCRFMLTGGNYNHYVKEGVSEYLVKFILFECLFKYPQNIVLLEEITLDAFDDDSSWFYILGIFSLEDLKGLDDKSMYSIFGINKSTERKIRKRLRIIKYFDFSEFSVFHTEPYMAH